MDLRRETDIEQLRRVALAQQVQIEQLLRVLREATEELQALKGSEDELQQKLALVEQLSKQAKDVAAQIEELTEASKRPKKRRSEFGNTAQPSLPIVEETFTLELPVAKISNATCRRCGAPIRATRSSASRLR